MQYPLLKKIEGALSEKGETKAWLSKQIDISLKTLYGYDTIGKISLDMILTLSRVLDFNFLEDYNKWLIETGEPAISKWQEEDVNYSRSVRQEMTMSFYIKGERNGIAVKLDKVLEVLQKECEKYGLDIV